MKKLLSVAAVLLTATTLAGCSKVTLENYEQLSVGQDRAEVEMLLGKPDACEEKTLHDNCIWGSDKTNIQVTFVSDKVTLFSEKGL